MWGLGLESVPAGGGGEEWGGVGRREGGRREEGERREREGGKRREGKRREGKKGEGRKEEEEEGEGGRGRREARRSPRLAANSECQCYNIPPCTLCAPGL